MEVKRTFGVGDVLVSRREEGDWMAVKVLAVDSWPDGDDTLQCLVYRPIAHSPTADSFRSPDDHGCHGPISAAGFAEGWEVLCTSPIQDGDLDGYHLYLKMTDFGRYLEVTGQSVDAVVAQANAYYRAASALDDDGRSGRRSTRTHMPSICCRCSLRPLITAHSCRWSLATTPPL